MKRTINDRRDTSFRPTVQGSRMMPFQNVQTLFRFRSESRGGRQSRQVQLPITQGNFQAVKSSSVAVVANQIRPNSAALNPRYIWNCNPRQMNGHFASSFRGRGFTQFFQSPRYFSWRNPVNTVNPRVNITRMPSNSHRFQELQSRSFTSAHPRYRYNAGKLARNVMSRKWIMLPEGKQSSPNDFKFSVVSYNILSDRLLFDNRYLYEDCSDDVLRWEFRKENLLTELLNYKADILCLQEVDANHYEDWFEPKLKEEGYTGVYNQRTGGKTDGCAIFYQHAKFTLVSKKLVKYYTQNFAVLNKDNVGVVLLLQANIPKREVQGSESDGKSQMLCVANTHLLFNKKRGDIKLAQLAYLLAEVDSLAMLSNDSLNEVYCPVILCGDLNCLPYSPLHYFLTAGYLDYSNRSPSVLSGQLLPSESTGLQAKRCITTPLLPWNFGVTMDCQWRSKQDPKEQSKESDSEGNSSETERTKHEKTRIVTLPFKFQSVYKHRFDDGSPEVTTCHSKACCNVDYIFYTHGIRERQTSNTKKYTQKGMLTLLGKLELLKKHDFNLMKLPNHQLSSDHLALLALFKLS